MNWIKLKDMKLIHRMFISALFTIAKIWKQPKYPSRDERIKKMWIICTIEYYSAIKKKEISPFATTWMDLEGITLSEINQTEKVKYCMLSLICGIQKIKQKNECNKTETDV